MSSERYWGTHRVLRKNLAPLVEERAFDALDAMSSLRRKLRRILGMLMARVRIPGLSKEAAIGQRSSRGGLVGGRPVR